MKRRKKRLSARRGYADPEQQRLRSSEEKQSEKME